MAIRVDELLKVLGDFIVLLLSLIVIVPFSLFLFIIVIYLLPVLTSVTIVNQSGEPIALIQIHDMAFKETVKNLNPGEEDKIVMEAPCFPLEDTYYGVDVEWVSGRKIKRVIDGCSAISSNNADMIITKNNIEFLETRPPWYPPD